MGTVRTGLAGVAIVLAAGTAAFADSDWQSVQRGGVTMDIPAVVGTQYTPTTASGKNEILDFLIKTEDGDKLFCVLSGQPYDKKLPHAKFAAALATDARNIFCGAGRDNAKDGVLRESESLTVSGAPAGRCLATYTLTGEAQHGLAVSALAIAAAKRFFLLTCEAHADDDEEIAIDWTMAWGEQVTHMHQSLVLTEP